MSEDAKKEEVKTPEVEELAPFQYGAAPSLIINMVRETRVYRFEMPIGAKLSECEEACNECLNVVKKMIVEAEKKQAEAQEKEEAEKPESSDVDSETEDK